MLPANFITLTAARAYFFPYRVVMKTLEEHPVDDGRTADLAVRSFDQCPHQIPGFLLDALQVAGNPAVRYQDNRTSAEEFPEGNLPPFRITERKIQRDLVSLLLIHRDLSEDLFFAESGMRCHGQEKLPGEKESKSIHYDAKLHSLVSFIWIGVFSTGHFQCNGICHKYNPDRAFRSLEFAPTEKYYIFTAPATALVVNFSSCHGTWEGNEHGTRH
jgi:hypothetical protein